MYAHSPRDRRYNQRCHSFAALDYVASETEDSPPSPTCSDAESIDDEEVNRRMQPFWPTYQTAFKLRGLQLDTLRDVKALYGTGIQQTPYPPRCGYNQQEDGLCPDPGLPDNLFRGTRIADSRRFVVKAVHSDSREFEVISALSRPPLRNDPMNHTIPVLDLFNFTKDNIAFIVMEEWSSQLVTDTDTCCLSRFLSALRQCIEHAAFMHKHNFAHLDISLRNLLTDYKGRYAYIDYELSRQFTCRNTMPLVYNYRATEVPPECEKSSGVCPYRVDVWALAVLILRACKMTGYWVPELMTILQPMLDEEPSRRPSSSSVLHAFDKLMASLGHRVSSTCTDIH